MHHDDRRRWLDRRTFLGTTAAAGLAWAGQALGAGEVPGAGFRRSPRDLFPQGIASGDPAPHGITLWTRLAPEAARRRERVPVEYEVARDPFFLAPVLAGITTTGPERDFTVKVTLEAERLLEPGRMYFYRFLYGRQPSPVGRFKTLPAPDADVARVRLAFISCQDFTNGYYTALAHLAEEDIDFVVHLGDYIYETVGDPAFQRAQVRPIRLPSGAIRAETLEDYRFLYRTYRSDPYLQRLHARFAFIGIWDDHEFANDAYREFDTDSTDEAANFAPKRRLAASRAWAEYIPAATPFDPSRGPLASIRIYRSFAFGRLMELVMTDERLYRDGPPCGLEERQRYVTPGCAARLDPERTMLGPTQQEWFLDTMRRSLRTWKVWGNEVMAMQLKLGAELVSRLAPGLPALDLFFTLDQWDGYPAERAYLLAQLQLGGVRNLITITGDIHSFFAGYLKTDFDDPRVAPAGVEFVCGSVTSANLSELATLGAGLPVPPAADLTPLVLLSNPHVRYFNSSTHGYNLLDVTPDAAVFTMKAVSTVRLPWASLHTLRVFRIPRDEVRIVDDTALVARAGHQPALAGRR